MRFKLVTGVQTCALPISITLAANLTVNEAASGSFTTAGGIDLGTRTLTISGGAFKYDGGTLTGTGTPALSRTTGSGERRGGEERRSPWGPDPLKKKKNTC